MTFKNIHEYEFSPIIEAEIFQDKYERWDISIEQIDFKNEIENEIKIEFQTFGYEGQSGSITFTVEQMEDLIAKFKEKVKSYKG